MFTPAIRAILYPSSAPQAPAAGERNPGSRHPSRRLLGPFPNEKPTRARMRRRVTGGTGCVRDRSGAASSQGDECSQCSHRRALPAALSGGVQGAGSTAEHFAHLPHPSPPRRSPPPASGRGAISMSIKFQHFQWRIAVVVPRR